VKETEIEAQDNVKHTVKHTLKKQTEIGATKKQTNKPNLN